jgi:cell division protein FtsQ
MNAKGAIRKFLFITIWLTIGTGMLILLIAAIGRKNHGLCRDYTITIKGRQNKFFIDEKDVQKLLVTATNGNIKGQQISLFNLHQLEQLLEDNTWIKDAELYFDNRDLLHITIKEREPIARIFTTTGNSFYIDSIGRKMPLSDKTSARVPVFTGFPEKKILNSKDSFLLNDVITTARFIYNDPFWMAQTAQIDITSERTFEMIPVVGNHTIKLGDGENMDQKFHRLFVFYKEVLSKTGFDKYKVIDVQYAGQVIGSRRPDNTKVDLVQLRKNVEKLLQEAMDAQTDTIIMAKPVSENSSDKVDSSAASKNNLKATLVKDGRKTPNLNPMKTMSVSKPDRPLDKKITDSKSIEKKENKSKQENKKPKAVMPKKVAEDNNGGYN